MGILNSLFNFRKPNFLHFDYLDIVIEEKSLLYITWELKYYYRIHVRPGNKNYRSKTSAVVLKIPGNSKEAVITLHSLWRKRRFRLPLKKVQLDKSSAYYLIKQLKPFPLPTLILPEIKNIRIITNTRIPILEVKKPAIAFNTKIISVNKRTLSYTTKFNQYE